MDLLHLLDDVTKNDVRTIYGDTIPGLTRLGAHNDFGISACHS